MRLKYGRSCKEDIDGYYSASAKIHLLLIGGEYIGKEDAMAPLLSSVQKPDKLAVLLMG